MKDEGRAGKTVALVLLMCCAFLCAGCGDLYTNYTFSSAPAIRQQGKILRVVESTAHEFGMTKQVAADHYLDEGFDHTYLNDSLTIRTESDRDGKLWVSIDIASRHKSPDFVKAENLLTPVFRRIDPHVKIETQYIPNPMM